MLTQLEVRCTACRDGVICAPEWEVWYTRCDEAEATWAAEFGSVDGFLASSVWLALAEDRPDCEPERPCPDCGGIGLMLTPAGHEVLAWARARLDSPAA